MAAFVAEILPAPQIESAEESKSDLTELRVVAIGSGTKSLGIKKMEPEGYLLNDCHAEIFARRSLQRTLMKEIVWHLRGDQTKKAFILSMSAGADRKFSIA